MPYGTTAEPCPCGPWASSGTALSDYGEYRGYRRRRFDTRSPSQCPSPHQGDHDRTTTDVHGAFSIQGLAPGSYTIQARLVGYGVEESRVGIEAGHSRHLDLYLQQQSIDLDGVVVSANRQETLRRHAPSLVTVLSQEIFKKTNSENLSQGLRFQPGLRIEDNCQNCGFNQVRINGLEGAYSQILIDSRPIFSSLAGVYGLEQIPASMIERVEVVRGGWISPLRR